MPQESLDPALYIFAVGTILLSIGACVNVLHMRRKGALVPYEPRRPVPWGAVGCILAMIILLNAGYAALHDATFVDGSRSSHSLEPLRLIVGMIEELFIVGGLVLVIAVFTKATLRDFGLPTNIRQFVRDVSIGAAACLVALAPVHISQIALMTVFFPDMKSGHPLIKMVMDAPPDPWILLLTGLAAVVVAPICEEIAFRLLLQGWLERWTDGRLGWRRNATNEMPSVPVNSTDDETIAASDKPLPSNPMSFEVSEPSFEADPPSRGIAGLSYGWFPIIASSVAFGLAHLGYGPEPVPLFLLGLVLGYIYQRTHRIIPSIVAHALFNLFTMIILWRMIYHHG
jgi:membrane protease YdiL (CAAX protease family)